MPIQFVLLPPDVIEIAVAPVAVDFVFAYQHVYLSEANLNFPEVHMMRHEAKVLVVDLFALANEELGASDEYDGVLEIVISKHLCWEEFVDELAHLRINKEVNHGAVLCIRDVKLLVLDVFRTIDFVC